MLEIKPFITKIEVQQGLLAEVRDQEHLNLRSRCHSMQLDFWGNVWKKYQKIKKSDFNLIVNNCFKLVYFNYN